MAFVQTVRGRIDPAVLGHTQIHEHLIWDLSSPVVRWEALDKVPDIQEITLANYQHTRRHHPRYDLRQPDAEIAIAEVRPYVLGGGRSIVDATPVGIGRDPRALLAVAEATGANVVMGSGYYTHHYHPPAVADATVDDLAREFVADHRVGIEVGDVRVRAGVIGEIGTGWPIHPDEEKVLRAAALAQRETGLLLIVHPGRDPRAPAALLALVAGVGGRADRVVMSHTERTLFTAEEIRRVADTGCYVAFDLFGREASYYTLAPIDMPNDATRVDLVAALVDAGHGDQVLLSQDICYKSHLLRFGGEGYTHLIENVVPIIQRKLPDATWARRLLIDNPARALAVSGDRA